MRSARTVHVGQRRDPSATLGRRDGAEYPQCPSRRPITRIGVVFRY